MTDAELGEISAELRSVTHESSWERALGTGRIILRRFFKGSVGEWRSHRRDKEMSLRRLARRPDCPLGKSALCDAVAVFAFKTELPAFIEALTPSHVVVALRLPAAERDRLLERAVSEGWSVRRLRNELKPLQRSKGGGRARPSRAHAAQARIKAGVTAVREACELIREPDPADRDAADSLWDALGELEDRIAAFRESVASLRGLSERPGLHGAPSDGEFVTTFPGHDGSRSREEPDRSAASG